MSTRPNRAAHPSTQLCTDVSSVTSRWSAVPGLLPSFSIKRSVSPAARTSMSPPATMAPSRANRLAATLPIPRPVPDSRTTLPSSTPPLAGTSAGTSARRRTVEIEVVAALRHPIGCHLEVEHRGRALCVGRKRTGEGRLDVGCVGDRLAVAAAGLGELREVRLKLELGRQVALFHPVFLQVADRAEGLVVEDAPGHGQVILGSGRQHRHDHLERAVPDEAQRRAIRVDDLRRGGGGGGEAHAVEAGRRDEGARLEDPEEREGAGDVLGQAADVDGDRGLPWEHGAGGADDAERAERGLVPFQRLVCLRVDPGHALDDLAYPGVLGEWYVGAGSGWAGDLEKLLKYRSDVAHDPQVGGDAAAELGGVQVHLQVARSLGRDEPGAPVGLHLLEPGPEAE